jgi:hypothetical protein
VIRSLLARVAFRKPTGLYIGEREVTLCRVASTLLGPVELETRCEPSGPEQLPVVLERLFRSYATKRGSPRVRLALGLPATAVFFSTRLGDAAGRVASRKVLLQEAIRSPSVNVDELECDITTAQPGKHPLLSLIACKRRYLATMMEDLQSCGVRVLRAEPAPLALLRLGARRYRGPRKGTVVRAFLGPAQGVAVLLKGAMPLSWRTFELPAGGEAAEVLATALALQVVGRHCGEAGTLDAVILHGRADLAGAFRAEPFTTALGGRVTLVPGPSCDSRAVAMGLALGAQEGEEAFDLARALKSRPPLREVIPWGTLAAQVVILAVLTLMLDGHRRDLSRAHAVVRTAGVGHAWAAEVDDQSLEKEKKDLEQKVAAVRGFLETRVLWTSYTRDAASRLTENMSLKSFTGVNELATGASSGKGRKSLVLDVTAPAQRSDGSPGEIEHYLDALRADTTLRRDFPQVELANLTAGDSGPGASRGRAGFIVSCLSKAPAKGKGK